MVNKQKSVDFEDLYEVQIFYKDFTKLYSKI